MVALTSKRRDRSASGRGQAGAGRLVDQKVLKGVGPGLDIVGRDETGGVTPATSRMAGMSDATTAVPWLMASSTGSPKPSCRLGKANTVAPAYRDHNSSSPTWPS